MGAALKANPLPKGSTRLKNSNTDMAITISGAKPFSYKNNLWHVRSCCVRDHYNQIKPQERSINLYLREFSSPLKGFP